MPQNSILIVGGNSPAGFYLMHRLAAKGLTASVISRRPLDVPEGFTKISVDLNREKEWRVPVHSIVLSLLPLWMLAEFLPHFIGAQSIIATGSTSRFSKADSDDVQERATAEKLQAAEAALTRWAEAHEIPWTLLRPTLIYDCRNDKNITRMAHFIRRWRFLPVGAPALGLRQPIHTDDVAKAIVKCIGNPDVVNRALNIAGGEVLTYREMAERVFAALGYKPRFILLPVNLLKRLFRFAAYLGVVKEKSFGAAIFQRMNEDLIFDVADGLKFIDYKPRGFNPEFPDTL
jgi:nucleoside-diphosphate-sugar epimerase